MARMDKMILTGAWAAMAVAGAHSYWKISETPKIDPTIEKLCSDPEKARKGPPHPPGEFKVRLPDFGPTAAGLAYIAPEADLFRTRAKGMSILPKPVDVQVLPFPVMGEAKATLDGTTLAWSLEDRKVDLEDWMIRKAAKPSVITVYRQRAEEAPQKLAELGPEARSYSDLSAEPLRAYRYWVTLTGRENLRTTYADADKLVTVTNKPDRQASATGPSATRVKLVGGDRTHAFLKIET
ncbi:MAG TPA: hypothetical protein VM222_04165, partial [Planctomycetota bacterium]|nr:hypothetical protein [Planctomycetota bacterium]